MEDLIWIVSAEYIGGHKLALVFNDGMRKVFDFSSLISAYPLYESLSDIETFKKFSVGDWTLSWCNGKIDIAPEFLYQNGTPC